MPHSTKNHESSQKLPSALTRKSTTKKSWQRKRLISTLGDSF